MSKQDKKLTESDLQAGIKEYLENIIALMPGHVYWKDKNSVYQGCNDSQAKDAGFSCREEIAGKTDYDMPWKEQADFLRKIDAEVMQTGVAQTAEEASTLADGNEAIFLSKKVPHRHNGEIVGVVGISFDITKQKAYEKALAEQVKKTEQAYHSKTEFIAIASHEIRSPIGNVIAMTDNLTEKLAEIKKAFYSDIVDSLNKLGKPELIKNIQQLLSEYTEETKRVKVQAFRSLQSLDNLGNLHRLQTEGIRPKFEVSGVPNLIDKVTVEGQKLNDKNVDIYLDISPQIPSEAVIDYRNIYEALCVIVGNAVRFSQHDGLVKIKVDITEENKKCYLVAMVQDFGVGISETQLAHLFEMSLLANEQNNHTRYRKPSLQLPQAKMKIEASGGRIQVDSKVGQGTIVTVYVPYQLESQLTKQEIKELISTNIKPLRLLLIEDDLTAQEIEKCYLEELGHHVEIASTGEAAVIMGIGNHYDVIVMDITLPDMDGISVMRQIRQVKGDVTPFIAVTSHALDDDMDYFISQGAVTVLTKPVTKQELKVCIRDVIVAQAGLHEDEN